jgi:hypothetical protein
MPLQAAAYAQAWAEMHDLRVPDRWVIRLDKETGEFKPVKFPRETFRRDLHGFLAAKELHLTINAMNTPKATRSAALISVPDMLVTKTVTNKQLATAPAAASSSRHYSSNHKPRQRSISYVKAGAAVVLGGATYDVKDQLPTIGGRRTKEDGNWVWQIPFDSLNALSALCNSRRILLIPTA